MIRKISSKPYGHHSSAHLSVIERFETRGDVLKFVVRVATNKVVDETRRRLMSQKRNVNREIALDAFEAGGANVLKSLDPSPSELAASQERWELVLGRQPDHYRTISNDVLPDSPVQQIARQMNVAERTVLSRPCSNCYRIRNYRRMTMKTKSVNSESSNARSESAGRYASEAINNWPADKRFDAKSLLKAYPELAEDKVFRIDVAYEEYRRRLESGDDH